MQFSNGCCLKNTQSSPAVVTRIPIRLVARTSYNILKTNKILTRRKHRQARRKQAHQGFWLAAGIDSPAPAVSRRRAWRKNQAPAAAPSWGFATRQRNRRKNLDSKRNARRASNAADRRYWKQKAVEYAPLLALHRYPAPLQRIEISDSVPPEEHSCFGAKERRTP